MELKDRQLDVLVVLVSRAGELVTNDAFTGSAWPDVAVTDNSLAQGGGSPAARIGRTVRRHAVLRTGAPGLGGTPGGKG